MELDDERSSDNVVDVRGQGGGGGMGFRTLGLGGTLVVVAVAYFLGVDPNQLLGALQGDAPPPAAAPAVPATRAPGQADDPNVLFVKRVLAKTEDTWGTIFGELHRTYVRPHLYLFTGSYPTACGTGETAMGPFYCPRDQNVYIDLAFYQELRTRFHAGSEAAQAYVIAHEVGHHVQNLLGVTGKYEAERARLSAADANALSVRLELQADCLAGVWAKRSDEAHRFLGPNEFQGAVTAAAAIGDDTLQRQARGTVVPETFTHGTSEERMRWLSRGFETGDLNSCNTFRAASL